MSTEMRKTSDDARIIVSEMITEYRAGKTLHADDASKLWQIIGGMVNV